MEFLVNKIFDKLLDMDFMDYEKLKEKDLKALMDDLLLLEKQGNGALLNALQMLMEKVDDWKIVLKTNKFIRNKKELKHYVIDKKIKLV